MSMADDLIDSLDEFELIEQQLSYLIIKNYAILHETEKAYLVQIGTNTFWLPKSECYVDKTDNSFNIPMWLATRAGVQWDGV